MIGNSEIKLTSKRTVVGLYVGAVLLLLLTPVIFWQFSEGDIHFGKIFAVIIYFLIIAFLIYQFLFLCQAKIVGDKLILKKLFRDEKKYNFNQIGQISSFQLKRTKYVNFMMSNDNGIDERYMLTSTSSLFYSDKIDAKQTLINLRDQSN